MAVLPSKNTPFGPPVFRKAFENLLQDPWSYFRSSTGGFGLIHQTRRCAAG